jgi:hypothetical protein
LDGRIYFQLENNEALINKAIALNAVAQGQPSSLPFKNEWTSDKKTLLIRRDQQRALRLVGAGARQGFVQFLWYYTSGQRAWRRAPRTIEALFQN